MKSAEKSFFKLENERMEVTLCSLGASIFQIKYLGKDMILTPRTKKDFFNPDYYHGKTIGRVCGRILANNEVVLHGGKDGLSTREFSYESFDNKVIFEYTSPDGESKCNGDLFIRVTYELDGDELVVKYLATVNKTCMVALTNHSCFCLGETSSDKLSLRMESNRYLEIDDRMLPVKMNDVEAKWNFQEFKSLSQTGDIDNFFQVKDGFIELKSSKYLLAIKSDFVGAQIYTDNFVDNIKTTLTTKPTHRGIAIEPQDNQLFRKELKLGDIYEKFITYSFKQL